MDYETFYRVFLSSYAQEPNLRLGQIFMNELSNCNPELYKQVPHDLDCFHNDLIFDACRDWVQEKW